MQPPDLATGRGAYRSSPRARRDRRSYRRWHAAGTSGGDTVGLARVVAGREFGRWRLHGNLLFQKPMASGRDPIDIITTVGSMQQLSGTVSLGIEGVAEDVEGFWDPAEAEGGARLLVGPSLHVAPTGRPWQLSLAGGPMIHPSDTGRSSGALRDLPASLRRGATRSGRRSAARSERTLLNPDSLDVGELANALNPELAAGSLTTSLLERARAETTRLSD